MDGILAILWLFGQLLSHPVFGGAAVVALSCALALRILHRRDMERYFGK